jgi:hypothetical protein
MTLMATMVALLHGEVGIITGGQWSIVFLAGKLLVQLEETRIRGP